jgi:HEPN domain-containing protein
MMMTSFDGSEYERWLAQAEHTVASARRDTEAGDFARSCFKAQQAGDYALKALLRGLGKPAHGHALGRLLAALTELALEVPPEIQEASQSLDRHYVPTRYPDAFPEGSPHEYYNRAAAEGAISAADQVIACVQSAS